MSQSSKEKPILLCGIQPTSELTIGNYIGALLPLIRNQDKYESILLVADLHAYTIPLSMQKIGFETIQQRSWTLIKWAVAAGVNPQKTRIVLQSSLKAEHLELFYFLLTHCKLGELKLMTQYKFLMQQFKQANGTEPALLGVLLYPVLMAADILLYDSSFLSIGEDQIQHLELCSSIRERINKLYSKTIFPNQIRALETQLNFIKIMDLIDPTKKMSKSTTNKDGVIFITDSSQEIQKKIKKAKTDSNNCISLNKEQQPGIHNLLNLYSALSDTTIGEAFTKFKNHTYAQLKKELGSTISIVISTIQENYKSINEESLKELISQHTKFLRDKAQNKLSFIQSNLNN